MKLRATWVVSSLLHLAACSASHAEAVSQEEAQAAFCRFVARCQPAAFASSYGSLERCLELAACRGPAVMPPGVEACVDELAGASCDALIVSIASTRPFCDVARAEPRRAREGESCMDRPCGEGLRCDMAPDPEPFGVFGCFVCMRALGPGDSCAMGSIFGGSDLCSGGYCDETEHCRAAKPDGEPCDYDAQCAGHGCEAGLCVTYRMTGEPCAEDRECAPELVCREGACTPSWLEDCPGGCGPGQTCREGACVDLTCDLAREGEPCDIGCAEGLFCNSSNARCEPRSLRDGTCDPDKDFHGLGSPDPRRWGAQCPDHQYCVGDTGHCADKARRDEPCAHGDAQCEDGLFCDIARDQPACVEQRPDGASCGSGVECTSGECYAGQCGVVACLPG